MTLLKNSPDATPEIAVGTHFHGRHGTKTSLLFLTTNGKVSWLLLLSLFSLLQTWSWCFEQMTRFKNHKNKGALTRGFEECCETPGNFLTIFHCKNVLRITKIILMTDISIWNVECRLEEHKILWTQTWGLIVCAKQPNFSSCN